MAKHAPKARRPVEVSGLERFAEPQRLAQPLPSAPERKVSVARKDLLPVIQADIGSRRTVEALKYRVYVPIVQVITRAGRLEEEEEVATGNDVDLLLRTFVKHFGGVTRTHNVKTPIEGFGARDPGDVAGSQEENRHVCFEVYAAVSELTERYFQALRKELEDALCEGVIFIEETKVRIVGREP